MDVFSALAVPTRRSIIEMLAESGQLTATAIAKKFHLTPPAISQHLKVLREAKLVKMEKRAQQRIYEINPATMNELEGWIKAMTKDWDERFDRLDKVINNNVTKKG